jgi:hypothetical protein
MAAGCSGEMGAGDEAAEIGSTAEALTAVLGGANNPADLTTGSGGTTDIRAGFASACVLPATVGGVTSDYLIRAGGFDSAGNPTGQIVVWKKGSAPFVQAATLTQANGSGQMVKFSATECAYVGGTSVDGAGTQTKKVDLLALSFSGTTPVITVTNKTDLTTARSNFWLGTCTESNNVHLVALGGKSGASELDSIEISNGSISSWTQSTAMQLGRMNFGADTDNALHIFAAGGKNSGSRDNTVDLIKLNSNCSFLSTTAMTAAAKILPHATDGLVVHYDATATKFIASAGTFLSGGTPTLETTERAFTVNWTTPDVTASADTANPANFVATYRAYPVRKNTTDIFLIGGSNAAINASIDKVQKYSGTWTSQSTTGNVGIYGGVGGYLANASEVWAMDGYSTAPSTIGVLVDAFGD